MSSSTAALPSAFSFPATIEPYVRWTAQPRAPDCAAFAVASKSQCAQREDSTAINTEECWYAWSEAPEASEPARPMAATPDPTG